MWYFDNFLLSNILLVLSPIESGLDIFDLLDYPVIGLSYCCLTVGIWRYLFSRAVTFPHY